MPNIQKIRRFAEIAAFPGKYAVFWRKEFFGIVGRMPQKRDEKEGLENLFRRRKSRELFSFDDSESGSES